MKAYQDTLDKLSKMKEQTALENTETVLGHSVYYFWELQKTNNYELIRKLRLPTYIVQGKKKDPLVPENEGWRQYNNKIGEGVKYVTYRSFPGLNHVLMSDSSTDAYGLPQYTENATLDISAGRSIGQWILKPEIDCRIIAKTENEVNCNGNDGVTICAVKREFRLPWPETVRSPWGTYYF